MVYSTRDCELDAQKPLEVKSAEVKGFSSRAEAYEKELAKVKKSMGQVEAAKNNFMELACDAEGREKKLIKELEDARKDWAEQHKKLKEEAIIAFLKSPKFETHCICELFSYYDQGKNHVLMMAVVDGIPTDQLSAWTKAPHYCAQACTYHRLVPFIEDKLITAKEMDEYDKVESWTPHPVMPHKVTFLADHLKKGGGAK